MKEYKVIFKKGDTISHVCPDKSTLINELFNGDQDRFKSEVSKLVWNTLSIQYIEDIQKEEGYAEIITADVNPYGWCNA